MNNCPIKAITNKGCLQALLFGASLAVLIVWYVNTLLYFDTIRLPADVGCVGSLDEFAFELPTVEGPVQAEFLPGEPWTIESELFELSRQADDWENGRVSHELMIMSVHPVDNGDEVWIAAEYMDYRSSLYIYSTETREWEINQEVVTQAIDVVSNVHYSITWDGLVGYSLKGHERGESSDQVLLMVYDEDAKEFTELAHVSITNVLADMLADAGRSSHSHFDLDGKLWLFISNDAIYRIDFSDGVVETRTSLSNLGRLSTIVPYDLERTFYMSANGTLVRYDTVSDRLEEIEWTIAEYTPPVFLDSSGTLWGSNSLWFKPNLEDVQYFHPHPSRYQRRYVNRSEWRFYGLPYPYFESSDGRIWFQLDHSLNGPALRSGIAWYDPSSSEGCWFTSESGSLFESTQNHLWLLVNGQLYRSDAG